MGEFSMKNEESIDTGGPELRERSERQGR